MFTTRQLNWSVGVLDRWGVGEKGEAPDARVVGGVYAAVRVRVVYETGEKDKGALRAESWGDVVCGARGELDWDAAFDGDQPEVAGEVVFGGIEDDPFPVRRDGWVAGLHGRKQRPLFCLKVEGVEPFRLPRRLRCIYKCATVRRPSRTAVGGASIGELYRQGVLEIENPDVAFSVFAV